MAIIYYSRITQTKISKGKSHMKLRPEKNQEQASKSPLPKESYRMHLIPPAVNCDKMCEMLSNQGSSLETQRPKFLLGDWSYRYPLPS